MTIIWHLRGRFHSSVHVPPFFREIEAWSPVGRSNKSPDEDLHLFFDKEADVPLAGFSDSDLAEGRATYESDDGDPGRGEAGDHERTGDPIFMEGAENQIRMVRVSTTTTFWWNLDIISSPDWDETWWFVFPDGEHSEYMVRSNGKSECLSCYSQI